MYPPYFWHIVFWHWFCSLDLHKCTKNAIFWAKKWLCVITLSQKNTRLIDHMFHEGNRYYDRWASNENFDRESYDSICYISTEVGGTWFVTMLYKGWVVGQNWQSLVLHKYWMLSTILSVWYVLYSLEHITFSAVLQSYIHQNNLQINHLEKYISSLTLGHTDRIVEWWHHISLISSLCGLKAVKYFGSNIWNAPRLFIRFAGSAPAYCLKTCFIYSYSISSSSSCTLAVRS